MVISCCAVDCTKRQGQKADLKLYRIPKEEERRQEILQSNAIHGRPLLAQEFCGDHFERGEGITSQSLSFLLKNPWLIN